MVVVPLHVSDTWQGGMVAIYPYAGVNLEEWARVDLQPLISQGNKRAAGQLMLRCLYHVLVGLSQVHGEVGKNASKLQMHTLPRVERHASCLECFGTYRPR